MTAGTWPTNCLRGALDACAERIGYPEPERMLNAHALKGEECSLLSAGTLPFGEHPQNAYPQAHVRVLRCRGPGTRTCASQNLVRDARCEGRLPEQVEQPRASWPRRSGDAYAGHGRAL